MSRCQQHIALRCISILLFVALLLPINGLAQSTVDLVIHYVEGIPQEKQDAYDVRVYLSMADQDGNPIKDLEIEDFTMTEDSQSVEIASLALAQNEPIHIVLVINNSRTMRGPAMDASVKAAKAFVASRNINDQIAVMTFNDVNETIIDFTTDHQDVQDEIGRIQTAANTGACLYDAIYQAVQMSASLTNGRRAILVLTDGKDLSINGSTCSSMTVDDVINAASQGGMRVPIYTLGLGTRVDEQELTRIAALTGGRYHEAENNDQLEVTFLRISNQYSSEYILSYTSYLEPGAHTLAVKVDYQKTQDQDTRNFILPLFPTWVMFVSPLEGQEVGGLTAVTVNVSGSGEPVSQVVLEVNEETFAQDSSAPYEFEVNFNDYSEGSLTITAIALGADEKELASESMNIVVSYAAAVENDQGGGIPLQTLLIIAAVLGVLVLLVIILALGKGKKKKKKTSHYQVAQSWKQDQTIVEIPPVAQSIPSAPVAQPGPKKPVGLADRTVEDVSPTSGEILGALIVEFSDDDSMVGHRFEINKARTSIGRSADNDIIFPKDSPISRHHACIEARSDGLYISEVQTTDSSGKSKPPSFGTFVNETPLDPGAAMLHHGDIIRLGKRVRVKFESIQSSFQTETPTMDDLDKTIA